MMNLVLEWKTKGGHSWSEEKPSFQQQSTQSYGADFGSRVLNFKINGQTNNVRAAIQYIVGYSQVVGSGSTAKLSRMPPARHPDMPNLRATKILSVMGRGNPQTPGANDFESAYTSGDGVYGDWDEAVFSVLFEIPKTQLLSDSELGGYPEYCRNTEWFPEEAFETLARKGQVWNFVNGAARLQTPMFTDSRILRQAKGSLKVITYDVAIDYVMLGKLQPTNGLNRLSTVNALPFPVYPVCGTTINAQYAPGTLLLGPSKYPPHTQCHPAVTSGQITPLLFPRTVDVERNFLWFGPKSADPSFIDLSRFTDPTGFQTGGRQTLIRGHQLVPLPTPVTLAGPQANSTWFAAVNAIPPTYTGFNAAKQLDAWFAALTITDGMLLYPYSDHERLWSPPETLNT